MTDYQKIFKDFWAEIVCNPDGTLNMDAVQRELADYYFMLQEVPKVYDYVTGGMISKPNTCAFEVNDMADEHYHKSIEGTIRDDLTHAAKTWAKLGPHDIICDIKDYVASLETY
jgi:hypothetical protein